jgi:acyl-CoA synthetase (AMP-forming)/AMP-acid ligase II
LLASGEVGEITVAGPTATDSYFNRDAATALAKIHERLGDGSERVVHRMGDLGYFDDAGRLLFCGRKSQRVGSLFTEQVEPVFDVHPDVRRTALVGVQTHGGTRAVLCVELLKRRAPRSARRRIEQDLRAVAARDPRLATIDAFLFHPGFPVDIRHNAKIAREKLAAWAAGQVRA